MKLKKGEKSRTCCYTENGCVSSTFTVNFVLIYKYH